MTEELTKIFFVSFLTESVVEYFFGQKESLKKHLIYIAGIFGVIFAFAFDVDILPLIGVDSDWVVLNKILSGAILSRGANYLHDLFGRFKRVKPEEA